MKLPNDSIGISDVLSWRDCPRRMSFSMRRWTEEGDPPEALNESNAYGSAIHEAFRLVEVEGYTDDQAAQGAFNIYGAYLWPHHVIRMKEDLATYHERDPLGVRLVGAEIEARVPLLEIACPDCAGTGHEAIPGPSGEALSQGPCPECVGSGQRTIYFRGQIDRLYQRLDDPSRFVHRDYKSSMWPKTSAEVSEDLQMWAYNWLIHEFWPECEDLQQVYDQLTAGEINTRKSDNQRQQIKEWLQRQVVAILSDDSDQKQFDGLLKPKFNDWCPYCPIMESCEVVGQLSSFAKERISALSEEGDLDKARIAEYVAGLDDAGIARKMLERYEKRVKSLLRELPEEERDALGFKTYQRRNLVWSSDAMESIHEMLGPEFFSLASLSKGRVEEYLRGDPRLQAILDLARKEPGPIIVSRRK